MTTMTITTGFLDGNLWEGANPRAYSLALHVHLTAIYPEASIKIISQPGSGSMPVGLMTLVLNEVGDEDWRLADAVDAATATLDDAICANPNHPVWAAQS